MAASSPGAQQKPKASLVAQSLPSTGARLLVLCMWPRVFLAAMYKGHIQLHRACPAQVLCCSELCM